MRHIFIVNPRSGHQDATPVIQKALSELNPSEPYEIYVTSAPGDATQYVRTRCQADTSPLRFYACGGDGTLNEVINGAAGFDHAAVGCYPCGSGNDFIKYFGGRKFFTDLGALMSGHEQRVDMIRVNDRYAINVVNMGFEAKTAARMIRFRHLPLMHGYRAYYGAIVLTLIDGVRHRCKIAVDGETMMDGNILLCTLANGDYVGGSFRCAPRADVADGQIEVCIVTPISRFRFARLIGYYQRGEHLDNPLLLDCIHYCRGRKVVIDADPGFLMCLDGEITSGSHFEIENVPSALRFIVPEGAAHHADGVNMAGEAV